MSAYSKVAAPRTHYPVHSTQSHEIVFCEFRQTDLSQEIFLPSLDAAVNPNWDKSLLAHGAAKAPSFCARGHVCQSVDQVVELTPIKELFRHIILQPQNFGDFHLYRHSTSHVLQKIMLGCIDDFGFLDRPMIKPQDDIMIIVKLRTGHRHRLVSVMGEDS